MIDQIRLDFVNNSPEIKKELEQLLLRYKTILSKSLYEYLKSLLNCEFSAIASIISDEEKETLCDLFIYRAISMYNIYNRTLNLLNSNFNLDFKICFSAFTVISSCLIANTIFCVHNTENKIKMEIYFFINNSLIHFAYVQNIFG